MSNPARPAAAVSPVARSLAAPLPVAKCRATTSGARRERFAAGTRRMVASGAPVTLAGGAADGQPSAPARLVLFADEPHPARAATHAVSAMAKRREGLVIAGYS